VLNYLDTDYRKNIKEESSDKLVYLFREHFEQSQKGKDDISYLTDDKHHELQQAHILEEPLIFD